MTSSCGSTPKSSVYDKKDIIVIYKNKKGKITGNLSSNVLRFPHENSDYWQCF